VKQVLLTVVAIAALVASTAVFAAPNAASTSRDAGASRVSGARLATRFLIVRAPKDDFSNARLEIVGRSGRLVRLVASGPADPGASLSPDRALVAWHGADGGIQVENVDGSNSRLLVPRKPGPWGMPFVWSPDSQKLLIRDANRGLSIVSVATGTVHEIIPPQAHVVYLPIAWSRPVHAILFLQFGAPGAPVRGKELVVASPSGASQRTILHLFHEPYPSWSPNGKWVAFTSDGPIRLGITNAATGTMKRVNNFYAYTGGPPVWAPNSSRFAAPGYHPKSIGLFSPAGKRVGSLKPTSGGVWAWTGGGIYLSTDPERRLLVIPHGQQKPRTLFTLPKGQALFMVQPF
jgi:WD40-like Beta Propeller Repeat